jgi:hypothetical protein
MNALRRKWLSNDGHDLLQFDAQLWNRPETWPHDPLGYVFLARAFAEVGHAKYGAHWAESPAEGEEPEDPSDDADDAAWREHKRAYEQYERACDRAKIDFENMRADVVRTIVDQCEIGKLTTAVRPKKGGEMVELTPHLWNTERFAIRFFCCDMFLADPFSNNRFHRSHWIYVTRDSLDQYLGKNPTTADVVQQDRREDSSHADSNSTRSGKRPPASEAAIRQAARDVYREAGKSGTKPPNMNQAQSLLRQKLPGHRVSRKMMLPILREPEFDNQRFNAGNHPKR